MEKTIAATALLALMVGCAHHPRTDPVHLSVQDEVSRAVADARTRPSVRVVDGAYVRAQPIDYAVAPGGNVTLSMAQAPLRAVVREIAQTSGYSVAFETGIDASHPVSVDLRAIDAETALREVALAAGLAAIVDRTRHTAVIAERASYTFRLPPHLLQNLVTQYAVTNIPSSNGNNGSNPTTVPNGGSAAVTGATGASSPGALSAAFSVHARQDNDVDGFRRFVSGVAGSDASVQVMAESGLVTVRARAVPLRRLASFFQSYVKDAGAQVELQVSIIEVSINEVFQFGIDWSRVIGLRGLLGDGASATVSIGNAAVVANPAVTTSITSMSSSSVIKALEQYTKVKLVSQPHLFALNHSPAIMHDGTQVPYLPNVTTTVTGTAGTTSNSGAISFALDGVSLAFKPNILDAKRVEISVVPVLASVAEFQTFNLGNGAQLVAPRQPVTQSHMQVIVESGKTVIVGGAKSVNDNHQVSGIPGTRDIPFFGKLLNGYSDDRTRKELVLLMRSTIIPAPEYDCLVAESL